MFPQKIIFPMMNNIKPIVRRYCKMDYFFYLCKQTYQDIKSFLEKYKISKTFLNLDKILVNSRPALVILKRLIG